MIKVFNSKYLYIYISKQPVLSEWICGLSVRLAMPFPPPQQSLPPDCNG